MAIEVPKIDPTTKAILEPKTNAAISKKVADDITAGNTPVHQAVVNAVGGVVPSGVVTSTNVGRIVAVVEGTPLPALSDGDLVIRYVQPGEQYALDFTGGTHMQPVTNLTKISGTDWPVVDSATEAAGAENAKVLRINGTDTYYTIPELVDDPFKADAEILVRYRHSAATQHGPQIYFYADDTYAEGFYVSYTGSSGSNGAAKVRHKVGTSHNDVASVNVPVLTAGQWAMMRARCQGNTLSFKVWAADAAEPAEWSVSATANPALPKRFAIGRTSNQAYQHLDWLSLATGGKTAVAQ